MFPPWRIFVVGGSPYGEMSVERSMNMKNANAGSRHLLLTAIVIALVNVSSLGAEKKSWEDDTVLISPQGDQTVARGFKGNKILFKNADPQLAIEWGLANAHTTVVLASKYVISDRIDIPRNDVTLIIDKGAELAVNPDTSKHTYIGFRPDGSWKRLCIIYNKGRANVRVISFGTISSWIVRPKTNPWTRQNPKGTPYRGSWPIFFDGRNPKGTCGIKGGMVLTSGSISEAVWILDSSGVRVPILAHKFGGDGSLVLEGCEDCRLGLLVNLASEPGGRTGETLDMNGRNKGIKIERAIGERPFEIIDNNSSYADVGEVVSIGRPRKLLKFHGPNDGARYTSRKHPGATALNVKTKTILLDATGAVVKVEVPKLPDALPHFTVKATVEVTMKDGSKKLYTKAVEIDVRTGGPKLKPIFNGKDLSGWKAPDKNIWWKVNDGMISCKSGPKKKGSTLWTEKKYKNFIIETDFRFGEGTVDSGIFLRTTKQQVQMGISGSLKRDMTCSIYVPGKGYPKEAKGVKQLLKPKDWNTINVKAVGGVYTMTLNGKQVLVFDGAKDAIEEGPIGLQLHGGKVMAIDFRDIRLAELE